MRIWIVSIFAHKPHRWAEVLEGTRDIKWVKGGTWCKLPASRRPTAVAGTTNFPLVSLLGERKQALTGAIQSSWTYYSKQEELVVHLYCCDPRPDTHSPSCQAFDELLSWGIFGGGRDNGLDVRRKTLNQYHSQSQWFKDVGEETATNLKGLLNVEWINSLCLIKESRM